MILHGVCPNHTSLIVDKDVTIVLENRQHSRSVPGTITSAIKTILGLLMPCLSILSGLIRALISLGPHRTTTLKSANSKCPEHKRNYSNVLSRRLQSQQNQQVPARTMQGDQVARKDNHHPNRFWILDQSAASEEAPIRPLRNYLGSSCYLF